MQMAIPESIPQVRKLLMTMIQTVKHGEPHGEEIHKKELKDNYEKVAIAFNANTQEGINLYCKLFHPENSEPTEVAVAEMFKTVRGLDKQKIGDFFEKRKDFQIATLKEYLHEFVKEEDLLKGFVKFIQSTKLPKETNSINHIFEDYSKYYCELHSGMDGDDVLLLISAILLLNVELHHPVMKNKRTKEEFVNSMKETTPKIPVTVFETIYEYIDNNEFYIPSEEPTMDYMHMEQDISFRSSWMAPYISVVEYSSKSAEEVVSKIFKPLLQNLQSQFELAV